jgi:acyl-homoserine-lactone acylase
LDEMIHVYNPTDGWLQNCNSTPFTVAGTKSPLREKYPRYMATDGENFRGINAVKIFNTAEKYNIDDVIKNAYNSHLAAFDLFIPALISANEKYGSAPRFASLQAAISLLSAWNRNSSDTSVATTLAIEWAQKLWPAVMRQVVDGDESNQVAKTQLFLSSSNPENLLQTLSVVLTELEAKFGTWRKPWGSINRYQRLTGNLTETFDDNKPSIPDGFAASTWGCLPSFVSRPFSGTKLRYGYNGNSFICAVEFGKRVVAKSLLAGGNSGDPASAHFGDQAEMYTKGRFKEVLFYKEDVLKQAERTYKPGE